VTYPADTGERRKAGDRIPACEITRTDEDDEIWIPKVTELGLTIITRDIHISQQTRLRNILKGCGGKMFAFTDPKQLDGFEVLESVMIQWRDMERRVREEDGPFIYECRRTSMRRLDL
jgi:hypothetical protein